MMFLAQALSDTLTITQVVHNCSPLALAVTRVAIGISKRKQHEIYISHTPLSDAREQVVLLRDKSRTGLQNVREQIVNLWDSRYPAP